MTLMPTHRFLFGLIFLVGLVPANAFATGKEVFLSGIIADEVVARAVEAANNLLPKGRLRDGSSLAPVTPKERLRGVIPPENAHHIVKSAADSALTEHCGLDWRNLSFRPLMRRERRLSTWSERQLAFIGILHGYVQATYRDLLKTHQRCSDTHKQAIVNFFARKQR